ncbi:hypothetical protein ACJ41O_012561 [Fusarium nematophilum]
MHFTTAIVTLALAATARADFYIASAVGMNPGCAGRYCAGNPVWKDAFLYHSGQEDDVCGKGRSLGHGAGIGTWFCDTQSSFDADICGRKVVFSSCSEIGDDEPFANKHFADVLDEDGNKIGECHGASESEGTRHEHTCVSWGSSTWATTAYCKTEGHDDRMC